MKKAYLKPPNEMCDWWFIYNGYYMIGMGEKPRNIQKIKNEYEKKRKKFPIWLLSHLSVYKMEAVCFLVSENTENKSYLPYVEQGS